MNYYGGIHDREICLPTFLVPVDRDTKLRLLLDWGASRSFLLRTGDQVGQLQSPLWLARDPSSIKTIKLQRLGSSSIIKCPEVELDLGKMTIKVLELPSEYSVQAKKFMWVVPDQLRHLPFTEDFPRVHDSPIHVIIGQDYCAQIMTGNLFHATPNLLISSCLWGVFPSGLINSQDKVRDRDLDVNYVSLEKIKKRICELFESEKLPGDSEEKLSKDDLLAIDIFNKTLTYDEKHSRYTVRLPFRTFPAYPVVHNNLDLAEKRFFALEKKLLRAPKAERESFVQAMNVFFEEQTAEEVFGDWRNDPFTFYLAYRGVYNPSKATTKSRIVHDAGQQTFEGVSLNTLLLQGPKLQTCLVEVLLQTRVFKYVVTCDVSKMFLNLAIEDRDADYLRFLYRPPGSNHQLSCFRIIKLAFGLNCSPYLAIATFRKHIENWSSRTTCKVEKEACGQLLVLSYVDDCTLGADSERELQALVEAAVRILKAAHFEVRKFCSNSSKILAKIPTDHKAPVEEKWEFGTKTEISQDTKTLGLSWSCSSDSYNFVSYANLARDDKNTRRSILSLVSKIAYDSLGLLSPLVLKARLIVQSMCRTKLGWDDPAPDDVVERWRQFQDDLPNLKGLHFPRRVHGLNPEIHCFVDASNVGLCCAIYCRFFDEEKKSFQSHLIFSRTKTGPLEENSVSIPRLELAAIVLGVKCIDKVLQALQNYFKRIQMWSDSEISLCWLKKEANTLVPYVGNRVLKWQDKRYPIRYVESKNNSADIGAKSGDVKALHSSLWRFGPQFLKLPEEQWPDAKAAANPDGAREELRKSERLKEEVECINLALAEQYNYPVEVLALPLSIDEEDQNIQTRLNTLCTLYLAAHRFLTIMKENEWGNKNPLQKFPDKVDFTRLAYHDMAINFMVRKHQELHFCQEIHDLRTKEKVSRDSRVLKLNPVMSENGILRAGGRLQFGPFEDEFREPAILDGKSLFVQNLILFYHNLHQHAGVKWLQVFFRQKFWILRARSVIKKAIHKCFTCRIYNAKRASQMMAPLPKFRFEEIPFACAAVDYAGPFQVTSRRTTLKVWVCVFCCLSSRAVHLEIVQGLDTESFLNALTRFLNCCGFVKVLVSDNGTQFVKGAKVVQKSLNECRQDAEFCNFLNVHGIKFITNPAFSSHTGGVFEIKVKAVKTCLRKHLKTEIVNEVVFYTLIRKIQGYINDTPLCAYVDEDSEELHVVTPSMLTLGRRISALGGPLMENLDAYGDEKNSVLDRYERTRELAKKLRDGWRDSYMQALLTRPKWTKGGRDLKVGDEVLLLDSNQKNRYGWPIGWIKDIHYSNDSKPRYFTIQTKGGLTTRAAQYVLPLELHDDPTGKEGQNVEDSRPR